MSYRQVKQNDVDEDDEKQENHFVEQQNQIVETEMTGQNDDKKTFLNNSIEENQIQQNQNVGQQQKDVELQMFNKTEDENYEKENHIQQNQNVDQPNKNAEIDMSLLDNEEEEHEACEEVGSKGAEVRYVADDGKNLKFSRLGVFNCNMFHGCE